MKKHNTIWNISIVGIIIGGLITLISYMKFEKANRHYNLSITNGNFDSAYAWSDDVEKFKIILIIVCISLHSSCYKYSLILYNKTFNLNTKLMIIF